MWLLSAAGPLLEVPTAALYKTIVRGIIKGLTNREAGGNRGKHREGLYVLSITCLAKGR